MSKARLMGTPGEGLGRLREGVRTLLDGRSDPCVGYMPGAALDPAFYFTENQNILRDIARVRLLDLVAMDRSALLIALDECDLLYAPGGNTFVLASRLRQIDLTEEIGARIRAGLPYVGFSAGAVLCGLDILNSQDINAPAITDFDGLALIPFSINVHYPTEPEAIAGRDERIAFYHAFHSTPVLALEDEALLDVDESALLVREGRVWLFDNSGSKRVLGPGDSPSA